MFNDLKDTILHIDLLRFNNPNIVYYDVTATIFKNFLIVSKFSDRYDYEAEDCSLWVNLDSIKSLAGVTEILTTM